MREKTMKEFFKSGKKIMNKVTNEKKKQEK